MNPTRGIRNNNPGNLRITLDVWLGLCPRQNDDVFFQFSNMTYGIRALLKTLMTYHKKGYDTVEKIINRWAPAHENPTVEYIDFVAKEAGFEPDKVLSADNDDLVRVAKAIVVFENGRAQVDKFIPDEVWGEAVDLLTED